MTVRDRFEDASVGGTIALAIVALVVLAGRGQDLLPSPARMAVLTAWPIVAILFAWKRNPWIIVAFCIVAGFVLRWVEFWPGGGSDVLPGTTEWIETYIHGQNPYSHFYTHTQPQGSPVPYPPIHFLLNFPGYLLDGHTGVRATQLVLATAAMAAFGALAARLSWIAGLAALALYATLGNLVTITVDGGMDTEFGAVMLFACLAAWWAYANDFRTQPTRLAGVAAAVAMGDKQPAIVLVICVLAGVYRLGGRRAAGEFILAMSVLLAVVAIPFLLPDPIVFLRGITAFAGAHDSVYGWNVWVLADQLQWPRPDLSWGTTVNVIATGAGTVGAMAVLIRSEHVRISSVLLTGALLLLVAFLSAPWSAYSYYASVAPLLLLLPIVVAWEHSRRPASTEASASGAL
jgi:hypothetical protein